MKRIILPAALLAFSHGLLAQQPPSGGALQVPPAPTLPRSAPDIRIEQRATLPAPSAEAVRIPVSSLRVHGATVYPEAELLALARFTPGSELALVDLQAMAARITDHYRRNGYFVAQAYLPAQDIRDGVVTIAVTEGRLGSVQLNNQSKLSDGVARSALAGLDNGAVIATGPFENRLLLLSDVPGVNVRSTLVPGAAPGTSDLMVDVTPGRRLTGSIDADNGGNRYTGAYRLGATVNLNNPLGLGDVASLRVLSSGSGLRYARGSYQLQAGRGQLGIAYSRLDYELGKEFASLRAHGTAQIASVFGRYPLL
ncbi:MAG: Polypeptide-transport-associated domain protein ShlB-type, partial [Ramlibacter sp.]|uniref:ShlB/FhaC/HecB family hemolysin secretion/activation protein n=1 Tax=Ramlibacter sp. TaxID=1917967 RepID=UPI002605DA7B